MRIPLFLVSLVLIGAAPVAGTDPALVGTATLSSDTEARWVPFTLTPGNQVRFEMTVDGKPVSAILDTGVSFSVLAKRYAQAAAMKVEAGGSATAIGGAVDIGWAPTRTMTLGGLTRSGGGLTVTDLPALATGSARPVDLLIGRDLIGGFALDIDYAGKRFRLLPSGRMPFTGATAPLSIAPDRLVYVSEFTLGAHRFKPVVVDTGDGSAVTVTAAGWRAAKVSGIATTTAIAYGLAGAATTTIGIVPMVRTGALVARNVEVRVEPAGGFSEAIGAAGRIGSGFLQNYRVLLDPGAGRMVMSPGPKADQPPLRSTSGLLVGLEKDRLRVLHVMKGGPAASAGWREGDTICSVDDQAITSGYASSPLGGWSAGTPGRIVALGLCDGTKRSLTLRRFY